MQVLKLLSFSLSAAVCGAFLSGCASTGACDGVTDDPRSGGLLGGVCNRGAQGAYEARLATLENETAAVEYEGAQRAAEGQRLTETARMAEAERQQALVDLEQMNANISALERDLIARERQGGRLLVRNQQEQARLNDLTAQRQALAAEAAALDQQAVRIAGANQRATASLAGLSAQQQAYAQSAAASQNQAAALQSQSADIQRRRADAQRRLDAINAQIAATSSTPGFGDLSAQIADTQRRIERVRAERRALEEDVRHGRLRQEEYERRLNELDEELRQLEQLAG